MTALTLRSVAARYGVRGNVVLHVEDLEIAPAEIVGVFGPNGIGKSTLLRLLAGNASRLHLNPEALIRFDDTPHDAVPRPYVAYAPQAYADAILPWYSIEKNLALPLLASRASDSAIRKRLDALYDFFELQERFSVDFNRYPTVLSGGRQQMLVLLRCLVRKPKVLLMDEPFSALDIYQGLAFRKRLQTYIEDEEITTLFVCHDLSEAIDLADRIVFLGRSPQGYTTVRGEEVLGKRGTKGRNLTEEEKELRIAEFTQKYLRDSDGNNSENGTTS